jgi:hypothetical protein
MLTRTIGLCNMHVLLHCCTNHPSRILTVCPTWDSATGLVCGLIDVRGVWVGVGASACVVFPSHTRDCSAVGMCVDHMQDLACRSSFRSTDIGVRDQRSGCSPRLVYRSTGFQPCLVIHTTAQADRPINDTSSDHLMRREKCCDLVFPNTVQQLSVLTDGAERTAQRDRSLEECHSLGAQH